MRKILVIDDEEWLREMVQLALAQKGYDVVEAPNGAARRPGGAERIARPGACDVNMEKMDGYGTLLHCATSPRPRLSLSS